MRSTIEAVLFFGTLAGAAWFLSAWMQRVYEGRPGALGRVLGPPERLTYRFLRVAPTTISGGPSTPAACSSSRRPASPCSTPWSGCRARSR